MEADESCNIRVICRFRPVNKREIAEGGGLAKQLTFPDNGKSVEVAPFNGRPGNTFNFDAVFHEPTTTQKEIYDNAANESICDVIDGYNSTIFAYGQTGAGKSFTMFGPDIIVPELKGIIPRACMHIFDHISKDTEGTEYTIKCSFLEIYKEIVRDLLNPKNDKKGLRVREAPSKGVWVEGLTEAYVTCEDDVLELIKRGESHRATSSTDMNASSSRSHSLFILTLHQKTRDGSTKEGKLNLADLAGSEKVGKTGATGNTLEEAKKINQSLSALGNCINALTKSNAKHIPYRDSKLTHILRESLGGNCKSTLLVACSPHIFNLEETVSTLMFAKRAKTIKNSVKVNKQQSVEELMAIIQKLKKELMYFKKYVSILEQELEKVKGPNWKDDLPAITQPTPKTSRRSKPSSQSSNTPSDTPLSPRSQAQEPEKTSQKSTASDEEEGEEEEIAEEDRVYSNSADMDIKFASMQVELKKLKEQSKLDILDLKEEIKSLTQDNENAEKQLNLKKDLIQDRDSEIKSLKEELEKHKQAKVMAEDKLQYEIKQLTLKEEEQKEALNALTEHAAQLKEKTTSLGQQLEDLESDKERLKRDHERISREREELTVEIKQKSESISTLEANISELEITFQSVKEQNSQWEANNKSLHSKLESIEGKFSALQTSSRETESKLRASLNAKELADTRIKDLNGDIETLEAELKETRALLHETREVKQAVQEAGQEKIEELLTKTVPLHDYDRVIAEKEKLRGTISEVKGKLNEEREALSNLRGELEEATHRHSNEKEEMQHTWDNEKEEHEQKILMLETKLQELEETKKSKIEAMKTQLETAAAQFENEKALKQKLEQSLEDQFELQSEVEKKLRRAKSVQEDQELELKQHSAIIQSQTRSLDAQAERIKQLELELEESTNDRELLQQEIKTALEINIENAKQFEEQLENVRAESTRSTRNKPSNIRVPVNNQTENRGIFASFFGIRSYPMLGEITSPDKFGFLLKRSDWLKKWEKRWFVLVKNRVLWFENNNQQTRAAGEIQLDGVRIVPAGEFTGRPNTMGILHRSRKEFYLQAPDEEDLIDWMQKLQSSARTLSNRLPKGSQSERTVSQAKR